MKTKWNWLFDRPGRSRKSLGAHTDRRLCVEHLENRLLLTATLEWANVHGSTGDDGVYGVSTDGLGNSYVAGWFSGAVDFDPGAGTHVLTSTGGTESFAAKYSPEGALIWATRMGSADNNYFDWAVDIAVGGPDNAVVLTGNFTGSAVFGTTPTPTTLVSGGGQDVFVAKLNGATGNIIWANKLGGALTDRASSLAMDGVGNVYVGASGGFSVAKFDVGGVWQWEVGGPSPSSIAVDSSGSIYNTGDSGAGTVDFDPGIGTFTLSSSSAFAFVQKLNSLDGTFVWAKQFSVASGKGRSGALDIAVDGGGNAYVTGYFEGKVDFDPGTGSLLLTSARGSADLFVSKLTPAGNLIWARQVGGTGSDGGSGIAVDGGNAVYLTGTFSGTVDFNPGAGIYNLSSVGTYDIGVLKLDAAGNFAWAVRTGGSDRVLPRDIAVHPGGDVMVAGYFRGTADFDPGIGAYPRTSAGGNDTFLVKLKQPVASLASSSVTASSVTANTDVLAMASPANAKAVSSRRNEKQETAHLIDAVFSDAPDLLWYPTFSDRASIDLLDWDSLDLLGW